MAELQPARWFHLRGAEQVGPLDLAQIRALILSGQIEPGTLVWADGMPDWMPAHRVPALVPPRQVLDRTESAPDRSGH